MMQNSSKRRVLIVIGILALVTIIWLGWQYWSHRPDSRLEDGTPVYGLSADDKTVFADQLSNVPPEKRTLTTRDKDQFLDSLTRASQ